MSRAAKLGKTTINGITYWTTKAAGKRVYFGNVKDVARKDAEQAFIEHRKKTLAGVKELPEISVLKLCNSYLLWSIDQFSDQNCKMKKSCLSQWCRHVIGSGAPRYAKLSGVGESVGGMAAKRIAAEHVDDFLSAVRKQHRLIGISGPQLARLKALVSVRPAENKVDLNSSIKARLLELAGLGDHLINRIFAARPLASVNDLDALFRDSGQPVGPTMVAACQTQIKAAWRWGVEVSKKLPADCRPFIGARKIKVPQPLKLESDLPTTTEVSQLLAAADRVLPGFANLLRCYYAIGPRTGELGQIRVCDVELRKRQITLGKHKREKTLAEPKARTLTLNADALAIIGGLCEDKRPEETAFNQPNGKPWTTRQLDKYFALAREAANVRDTITIYSFRHLWITDLLEAGTGIALIADMAGTSIRQIERTYGHVRVDNRHHATARRLARACENTSSPAHPLRESTRAA
jgi:integrase